jgi:lipid II:glycine glycyltransferase (peptidoglycan interpeptide bridge formation enzyme)
MLSIRTLTSQDKYLWDSLIQALPDGCFMQSWTWANLKELEGYQTFRYGLFANYDLIGGCIFYFYPHPNKANILMANGGPIVSPNYFEEGVIMLLEKGKNLAQQLEAIALRIEPLWLEKPNFLEEFVNAPLELLPSETLLIDLKLSDEERLTKMTQKGRYNLRLSWRYGVETEFTTDEQAIPLFYDLFTETVQRQQFFGEPYGFFINLCQTLFKADMVEIGLTRWQGEILNVMILLYWGKRAIYLYGGRSFEHSQVKASYNLHWSAMARAKQRGCQLYDFYGFTRNPNHNYAKFSQFKRQFGGYFVTTIGPQDYFFYDQLSLKVINLFNSLRAEKS